MKKIIAISLFSFLISCTTDASKTFKIDYEMFELDNGLTVIMHQDKSDPLVAMATVVHVGSNREKPGRTGFAHFFEHVSFTASENTPRGAHRLLIPTWGGQRNGGTSFDFTNAGTDSLTAGVTFIFTGNNTSHPFRMFITDNSSGTVTNLVNNLSFRGTQTFTLDPSIDYSTYTGTYICNDHPSMVGSFNISSVPEPSTYTLIFGSLALGLVALRRR